MRTVSEVTRLAGATVRTLHHYEEGAGRALGTVRG